MFVPVPSANMATLSNDAVYMANICAYTAYSSEMVQGCRAEGEQLCVNVKCCCVSGDAKINDSVGMITDKGEYLFMLSII